MKVRTCIAAVLVLVGCGAPDRTEVVVYTAHDEMFSRPIFEALEQETGIRIRAQFDTEASKTSGLVNRILAERDRPRADVFWNNEIVQTIVLKNARALAPYKSPNAETIPDAFKDPEHYWTGLAARARVIIYNTDLVDAPPQTVAELTEEKWRGKAAIANPLFGTTASHAAALFAHDGPEAAKAFFGALKANDVAILPGNATVRDLVARGEYHVGLTDTDDANGGVEDGFPVAWHFPNQGEGEKGTLVIPNTVALIAGGPNADAAQRVIDYLLSVEVEERLSRSRSIQIPLHPSATPGEKAPNLSEIRAMDVDFQEAAAMMNESSAYIDAHFQPE